ncbi:MAG: hypothetical protein KAY24_19625, partial [Candidatus Eisenbacteria sp.]|nr:hypothetical protein [Candidatus Eisenbacteria bacterium]
VEINPGIPPGDGWEPKHARYTSVRLLGNHPNPFSPMTRIEYCLPHPECVTLKVFDTAGRLVRTLMDGETMPAGHHAAVWQARNDRGRRVPSGVYLYVLDTGTRIQRDRACVIE